VTYANTPKRRTIYLTNFAAVSATRLPNNLAVSKSPGNGPSSGDESDGLCAIAPAKQPTKLISFLCAALELAGINPVPTQIMLCCMDKVNM